MLFQENNAVPSVLVSQMRNHTIPAMATIRRTSTADRRKTYVHLLEKGEKLCQEIQDAICNNLFADDETMAKSEVKNLNKALAIINKLMKS